jgi:hypothetical protein
MGIQWHTAVENSDQEIENSTSANSMLLWEHVYQAVAQQQWEGEGFIKYTVEMVSGAMIYIPSFIKISSSVQKLIGVDTHRDTQTAR